MFAKFKNDYPRIYLICLAFLFAFITILSCSAITSFVYPRMSGFLFYNDAFVFCELGKYMVKGYKPYVDIFDHKGLYIFYYTAISGLIGFHGVVIIQTIILTVVFAFIYKSISLYTSNKALIYGALFFFGALYAFGGQTPNDSDLELPFITMMIYFYMRGVKNNDYRQFLFGNICLGIAAGIAINLRLSDAMVPFAFACYFAYKSIKDKQVKIIFRDIGVVLGAIVLVSIPPFLHAYFGGFLGEMVQVVYLSNFKYITTSNVRDDGAPFVAYIVIPLTAIIFVLATILRRKQMSLEEMIFIYVTAGVNFLIQLIIAFYPHYLIVLFPYLTIIAAWLASYYVKEQSKINRPLFIGLASLFTLAIAFNPVLYSINYQTDTNTINYINENVTKEDKDGHILIFGAPALYELTDIKINYGDFTCQFNHTLISERYSKENLIKFMNSEDCHYFMVSSVNKTFVESLDYNKSSYVKISTDKQVSVTIYKHVYYI